MQSPAFPFLSTSRVRVLAGIIAATLLGVAQPALAADTLATNLQGKYALNKATLTISPLISKQDLPIPSGLGNTTIGSSGLAGIKSTGIQKLFKDAGLGSVLKAKVTKATPTSQKGTITGTLKGGGYNAQLTNGSYNSILGKSGWTIAGVGKGKLPVVGTSYSVAFTLLLKKQ
jgi:hypothetical protein